MKRILSFLLVALLTIGLCGCGGEQRPVATEPPEQTVEPTQAPTPEPEQTLKLIKSQDYDYGDGDTVSITLSNKDGENTQQLSFLCNIGNAEKASLAFVYLMSAVSSYSEDYNIVMAMFCDAGSLTYAANMMIGTNSDETVSIGEMPDWYVEELTFDEQTLKTYYAAATGFVEDFMSDL